MMCALLTYRDLDAALRQLEDAFGFEIARVEGGAEIRWDGGVAVAQTERPDELHGSHAGTGWTYVRVEDPDAHYARAVQLGVDVVNEPHSTPDGSQRGYSARDIEGNLWTFAILRFGADQSTPTSEHVDTER